MKDIVVIGAGYGGLVASSILAKEGYQTTPKMDTADLILVNTCSIREKAELTVRTRLEKFNAVKKTNPNIMSFKCT